MKRIPHSLVMFLLLAATAMSPPAVAMMHAYAQQSVPCSMHAMAMAPDVVAEEEHPCDHGSKAASACHHGTHCSCCHPVAFTVMAMASLSTGAGLEQSLPQSRYTSVTLTIDSPPPRHLPL